MRRNIRSDVLSHHLWQVRGRREDLRRVLGGGKALVDPTREEKERLQAEYVRLAPIEAGLGTSLPAEWAVSAEGTERPFSQRTEARVLVEAQEHVAVSAVRLLQTKAGGEEEVALEQARALFAYFADELERIANDEAALTEARRLEARAPVKRPADGGFSRYVTIGGWAMLIGGWW